MAKVTTRTIFFGPNLLLAALITSPLDAGKAATLGPGRGIVSIIIFMFMIMDIMMSYATRATVHNAPLALWCPPIGAVAPHGGGEFGGFHSQPGSQGRKPRGGGDR